MLASAPNLKAVSRWLLAQEAAGQAGEPASAAFKVCERLRQPLRQLTGSRGYRSLLSRALGLAGEEVPWLRGLQVNEDGSLERLSRLEAELGENEIAAGETALVAHLLALLVTFIGPALTRGILREIWPSAGDLNF
jgi:hypothetical protein